MSEAKPRKILVVDDEADVTDLVAYHLKAKGYQVETLNDPNRSVGTARSLVPDLVILDVMMPDLTGIQICRMLRADPKLRKVPVIFLTAKAEESYRIQGLEIGADDYISKPFSTKELVLRVQTILRRLGDNPPEEPRRMQVGGIVIEVDRHQVTVNGKPIELTATEFKLLLSMIESPGITQERGDLLKKVWGYSDMIQTRTLDTLIKLLREKLGAHGNSIETVRGVGYRFSDT